MFKKVLLSVVLLIGAIFINEFSEETANAYFECSTTSGCVDVYMKYNQGQYASSPSIYFSAGQSFKYDFETEPNSLFHVSVQVIRQSDGKQIGSTIYATGAGGWDDGYSTAPTSGYYYLLASCKGGDDTRCEGGGTLKKW